MVLLKSVICTILCLLTACSFSVAGFAMRPSSLATKAVAVSGDTTEIGSNEFRRKGPHVTPFSPTPWVESALSAHSIQMAAGPTTIEKPAVKEKKKEKSADKKERQNKKSKGWQVRLFNDPMNKREFVARCLMEIVGLTDTAAYQIMMQAHQAGVGVVGQYDHERAELYRNQLVEFGLVCDMIPMDDDK